MQALQEFGLQIAPEEVQQQPPWKYLGVRLNNAATNNPIFNQDPNIKRCTKTLRYHQLGMNLFRVNYPTFIILV